MIKLNDKIKSIVVIKKDKTTVNKVGVSNSYTNYYEEIELDDEHHFQIIPRKSEERDCVYIGGESGAGKSYYCMLYVMEYKKLFPKNELYIISYLDRDDTLDKIPGIHRLNAFSEEFLKEIDDIELTEFKNSLVIFDDIDSIPEAKRKKKIYGLLNRFLRLGRHEFITVIMCSHELFNRDETKTLLNESSSITWFPKCITSMKLERLLKNYFGFDKVQIEKIKSIKNSRYITILKGWPKVVISEHLMYYI